MIPPIVFFQRSVFKDTEDFVGIYNFLIGNVGNHLIQILQSTLNKHEVVGLSKFHGEYNLRFGIMFLCQC